MDCPFRAATGCSQKLTCSGPNSLCLRVAVSSFSPSQLEHARLTQTELMRESFRHNQEMSELLQKQEELQERLSEEARAREQLALELHHAEGELLPDETVHSYIQSPQSFSGPPLLDALQPSSQLMT